MTSQFRPFDPVADANADDLLSAPWGHYAPSALQTLLLAVTHRTFLQRGALRPVMVKAVMALGRPLDVVFRGCKFRVDARNNLIETGILTRPSYNAVEIDFLAAVLGEGGVALDIGSNVGLYALPLARAAGPQGRVIAIDANPYMIKHLVFNANASRLTNLEAVHKAVGGTSTQVDLQIRLNDSAIVRVVETSTGGIEMRPLLEIVEAAGLTRVDALKIDIEGHEDQALVPFFQMAPEALLPKRIVIERIEAGDYPGCKVEFARLGYVRVGQTRNNSLFERR